MGESFPVPPSLAVLLSMQYRSNAAATFAGNTVFANVDRDTHTST